MNSQTLSRRDRGFLEARGISAAAAEQQVRNLLSGTRFMHLDRPAVAGDGIHRLSDREARDLAAGYADRLAHIRVTKFVPASGAASRMFAVPQAFLNGDLRVEERFLSGLEPRDSGPEAFLFHFFSGLRSGRFAFAGEVDDRLKSGGSSIGQAVENGEFRRILSILLDPDHLGLADLPKALIPFHVHGRRRRTPLEEHMAEALEYGRGKGDVCKVHFTVSPDHLNAVRAKVNRVLPEFRSRVGAFHVEYSIQDPASDTLAVTPEGSLFRNRDGSPLLRPGGHGALIRNLDALDADLVFIKNIDNVMPAGRVKESNYWKRVLGGFLLSQQERVFQLLRDLAENHPGAADMAERYLVETQGQAVPPEREGKDRILWLSRRLNRPMRVCGMVVNRGEPGGGPYWVREPRGGASLQIVESAQINRDDPGQAEVLRQASHFNPVDLVCGLHDFQGNGFHLKEYVNPDTYFVAEKTRDGRPLLALEWPGLWNGAMHEWLTFLVEVPVTTFNPVKTVNDLLREEHQDGVSEA